MNTDGRTDGRTEHGACQRPRYQQLIRCLRLAAMLTGRRHLPAWDSMARELGVSTRTVRRYVAALEEAHWVVPPPRPRVDDYADDEASPRAVVALSYRGQGKAVSNSRQLAS